MSPACNGAPAPAASGDSPPRSGVPGLSPRQVRDRMAENGWGGIPLRAHDDGSKPAGKAPTINGWQKFAQVDAELPTAADRRLWERREGPGTGIPCGAVIGIDIDVRDPVLVAEIVGIAFDVFGETPFVRQGAAPKVLLAYRAAEPIATRLSKANDGSGDGLDIIGVGNQFVAFGVHPRTARPYEWLGAETPLTATPRGGAFHLGRAGRNVPRSRPRRVAAFEDRRPNGPRPRRRERRDRPRC